MDRPTDGNPQTLMVSGHDDKPTDLITSLTQLLETKLDGLTNGIKDLKSLSTEVKSLNTELMTKVKSLGGSIETFKTETDDEIQALNNRLQALEDQSKTHKNRLQALENGFQALEDKSKTHKNSMSELEVTVEDLLRQRTGYNYEIHLAADEVMLQSKL